MTMRSPAYATSPAPSSTTASSAPTSTRATRTVDSTGVGRAEGRSATSIEKSSTPGCVANVVDPQLTLQRGGWGHIRAKQQQEEEEAERQQQQDRLYRDDHDRAGGRDVPAGDERQDESNPRFRAEQVRPPRPRCSADAC